jgi:hypothetical protein
MTAPETNVRQDEDLLGGTKPNAGDTPVLVIVKDAEVIADVIPPTDAVKDAEVVEATPVLVVTPS